MARQGQFIKRAQKSEKTDSTNGTYISKPNDESLSSNFRQPLFEYPPLPRLEILTYFLVLISTLIYAWIKVYSASKDYDWRQRTGWGRFEISQWSFSLFGLSPFYLKDVSNYEWRVWTPFMEKILLWFIGHTLLFNFGTSFVSLKTWWRLMFVYWITAHCMVAGGTIIFITVVQGCSVFLIARLTKSKFLTWLAGIFLLYANVHNPFLMPDSDSQDGGIEYFISLITFSYKMLQYLSFATEMINENDQQKIDKSIKIDKSKKSTNFYTSRYQILNMFWYAFYLPYSYTVIVIYKRFPEELMERTNQKRSYKKIALFGLRILFWYIVCELALRYFYFEALMSDPAYLAKTNKVTLVSIGYAVGQFFHLKYVVMFGLPTFFALLDNMKSNPGPICITRVALYSKMWRHFDCGLYEFFKEYIFLPICRPTFSIRRKLFGLLVGYSFVLVWHGTTHKYVVWIILNVIELLLESVAKSIYTVEKIKLWREKKISDRNFRRILAYLQIFTFAFGFYSNFYFLGSSQSGYVFVERIFWEETVTMRWPLLILIGIGYCYCHVCMEVDRWYELKVKKE